MKKEYILESARAIIRKQGIQHLLMDEVARQCGISKKTIYALFESKEVLLESLAISFVTEQREIFTKDLQQQTGVKSKIEFILDFTFQLMYLVPHQNLTYLEKRHPATYQLLNRFIEEIMAQLHQLLSEAQQENMIYQDIDITKQLSFLKVDLQFLHKHYRPFLAEDVLESWQTHLLQSFRRSVFVL